MLSHGDIVVGAPRMGIACTLDQGPGRQSEDSGMIPAYLVELQGRNGLCQAVRDH